MALDFNAPFDSFQKRLRAGELTPPQLDDENRRRFGIPQFVVREAVPASRPTGVSEETWQSLRLARKLER